MRRLFMKLKVLVAVIFSVNTREEKQVKSEFDSDYYLSNYPDVKQTGVDPLKHYMRTGWREGRNPTSYFSTTSYLLCNPDVFNAGESVLSLHFYRSS